MKWVLGVFGLLLLVAACSSNSAVVCNDPYMLKGTECCLDSNSDKICDTDKPVEAQCPELDCSLCAAEVVTRNVTTTVTKFVCDGGAIVENPSDCSQSTSNAFAGYTPVTTNENGTVIDLFNVRTACRDGHNAIEFHWTLGSTATVSEIQVKESPEDEWETVFTYDESAVDKFIYGVFCNGFCTSATDIYLAPDKTYLVRARFDYNKLYKQYQYSNEYIVDATSKGEYMTKLC